MCQELEDAKFHISDLESKVYEISHDRDDVLGKLQRTVEDYVRHGEERQVANQGWESTESMLQNKVSTLDVVLEVTKDEVSWSLVDSFNGAIEQFKVFQPDVDTSPLNPFKSVVDGKIVDEEWLCLPFLLSFLKNFMIWAIYLHTPFLFWWLPVYEL